MTSHTSEKKSTGIGSLILAACLLLFALLPIADLAPIGGSTEAREAHVARAIYQSGEFILPLRNGIIPSKPPLYHWLAAGAAHALGSFDELAARLPSLIFGALLVGLVMMRAYSISQRYCNGVEPKDTAILAASSLTLLYGFSSLMLDCRVDMTMAFFVVSALLYLLGRLEGQQPVTAPSLGQWVVFFSLCGFATLAKGPLGVVLPCLIAVVVLSFSLGFKTVIENCPKAIPGLLIFLSIAVPWYVLAAAKGQESFIGRQLVFENLL
ncbi:MAG: hypothetical protein DCC75_13505, partial [Proteobacteria bacterium]